MKRVLLRLLVVFAVFTGAFLPAQLKAATTIQPGDSMNSSVGGCTLGFAATGGGNTYFMTAAHCVDDIGDNISLDDGTVFADVAVKGDADVTAQDWALLQVRAAFVPIVRGAVRGVAGAPAGHTTASQTALGDVLRFSGYGIPWFIDPLTRENRYGVVVSDSADSYQAIGMDTNGDSGGPIVHSATNKAYGLVSRLCIGACTSEGPTVQGVLTRAANKGFPVSLKTV